MCPLIAAHKIASELPLYGGFSCVVNFILITLFLHQIMKEIQEHKIKIYEFPDTEDDEDNKLIRKIKVIDHTFFFSFCDA